jgi:hypothetical protein
MVRSTQSPVLQSIPDSQPPNPSTGSKKEHTKSGCECCGTKAGCAQNNILCTCTKHVAQRLLSSPHMQCCVKFVSQNNVAAIPVKEIVSEFSNTRWEKHAHWVAVSVFVCLCACLYVCVSACLCVCMPFSYVPVICVFMSCWTCNIVYVTIIVLHRMSVCLCVCIYL